MTSVDRQKPWVAAMVATLLAMGSAREVLAQAGDLSALKATIEAEIAKVAPSWGVAPRVAHTDSNVAEINANGEIVIGTGFIRQVAQEVPEPVAQTFVRFVALHELWHVKQLNVYGPSAQKSSDALRRVYECQADVMASFSITFNIFSRVRGLSADDPEAKRGLSQLALLLPEVAKRSNAATGDSHSHLSEYERWTALRFGGLRALHAVGFPSPNERQKALHRRVARIINVDQGATDDASWSLLLCKKITRYGAELLNLHLQEAVPDIDTDVDYSPEGANRKFAWSFTNTSNRPIRVSVTAVSGYYAKGKSTDYASHAYHDGVSGSVDIPSGQAGTIRGEYRFTAPAHGDYEVFTRNWSIDKHTLITAEFIGPEPAPKPRSVSKACIDGLAAVTEESERRLLAAIMRIAGSARKDFDEVPKKLFFEREGMRLYTIETPIPGASTSTVSVMGSLTNAAITFFEGTDLLAARQDYKRLFEMMKRPCLSANARITERQGDDGHPSARFAPLSLGSAATLSVHQTKSDGAATPAYRVTLFIYADKP